MGSGEGARELVRHRGGRCEEPAAEARQEGAGRQRGRAGRDPEGSFKGSDIGSGDSATRCPTPCRTLGDASMRGRAASNPLRNKAIAIETVQIAFEVGQQVGQVATTRIGLLISPGSLPALPTGVDLIGEMIVAVKLQRRGSGPGARETSRAGQGSST